MGCFPCNAEDEVGTFSLEWRITGYYSVLLYQSVLEAIPLPGQLISRNLGAGGIISQINSIKSPLGPHEFHYNIHFWDFSGLRGGWCSDLIRNRNTPYLIIMAFKGQGWGFWEAFDSL